MEETVLRSIGNFDVRADMPPKSYNLSELAKKAGIKIGPTHHNFYVSQLERLVTIWVYEYE